ncbi:MAG: transmembrane 220 family protein [Alphaproteobacteria bacterium]
MRVFNGLFCFVFLLFAAVQYNDPDVLFWFTIYALAAIWCGLAAFMPEVFTTHGIVRALFFLCLIAALAGTFHFWPAGTAWWTKEVIWDNELVREGLGMAIVAVGMLSVALTWWLWTVAAER